MGPFEFQGPHEWRGLRLSSQEAWASEGSMWRHFLCVQPWNLLIELPLGAEDHQLLPWAGSGPGQAWEEALPWDPRTAEVSHTSHVLAMEKAILMKKPQEKKRRPAGQLDRMPPQGTMQCSDVSIDSDWAVVHQALPSHIWVPFVLAADVFLKDLCRASVRPESRCQAFWITMENRSSHYSWSCN